MGEREPNLTGNLFDEEQPEGAENPNQYPARHFVNPETGKLEKEPTKAEFDKLRRHNADKACEIGDRLRALEAEKKRRGGLH